jgi:RNA polymerase sigma factor (sigma-70 family)
VEDLVQEVFARLIAHRHYLQHPQAYVRAVAKHRLYSYWRNRRRDATSEQQAIVRCSGAVMGLTTCDWESDPLEQLTHREAQAMVGTMITCLSPTLGEALRLRFMGDLRSNEATARTGCSLGAWKKRLVRARRAFTELADGAATYRAAHLPGKRIDGESLTGLQSA